MTIIIQTHFSTTSQHTFTHHHHLPSSSFPLQLALTVVYNKTSVGCLLPPPSKIISFVEMSAQGLMGMEEETKLVMKKQGIVTILSSDCERNRGSSSSLRRTLSADMSSKKWLSQNGFFSPMKKTVSSLKLSQSESSSSDSESSDEERKDVEAESITIWNSIQQEKNKNKVSEKSGAFDMWSSIVSQKTNDSLPPPYVHPLVKRSQSSLSEKSLEICTENLGSETGSDGFSSYPSSETEGEKDVEEEEEEKEAEEEDYAVPKFNYSATSKKAGPRSFPPPLPSLSFQDGPSVHMRSHRENGRLVLEAVSVPSQNNFCAHRQDGRLLLTFNNLSTFEEFYQDDDDEEEEYGVDVEEEMEEEFEEYEKEEEENDDDDEEEEEKEEDEIDKSEKEVATILYRRIDNSVCRIGLAMNKPIGFANSNPKWSEKLDKVVDSNLTPVKASLPPRPRVARLVPSAQGGANFSVGSYFNPCEYLWRSKSTNHHHHQNNSGNKHVVFEEIDQMPHEQQKLMVERGKNVDYLVHNWRSCKESRRSLLFREPPQCIAT